MAQDIKLAFRPDRQGMQKLLGELEAEVMEIVWERGACTARVVHEHLQQTSRSLAYSTIKTVLERLSEKRLLMRQKVDNAYVYRPASSKAEFTRRAMQRIVDSLLDSFPGPVVDHFLDHFDHATPEQQSRLEHLVARVQSGQRNGA
ncbi:MAG TPA: BlaI/MecI/CopY family transcriptional regulator [Ktedonobacterales bacterium]|jgi:predicted transcriptional regulator